MAGQAAGSWDAIAIDAFVAATIPRRLMTVEALADVARVAPLAMMNVLDDRSAREIRTVAASVAAVYPQVWALGGRTGNTVVVGAVAPLDLDRIGALAAADPSPARLTTPRAWMVRLAGTAPMHDEELPEPRDD